MFEVAADSVRFFDNGVHAQLGDLVNKCVLVTLPVLHHCEQQRENLRQETGFVLNTNTTRHIMQDYNKKQEEQEFVRVFYRGLSFACTH